MGVHKNTGLQYGSLFFVVLWVVCMIIFVPYVYVRTKERRMARDNAVMTIGLSFFGVFVMWIMWACTFMHQMNPLVHLLPTDSVA